MGAELMVKKGGTDKPRCNLALSSEGHGSSTAALHGIESVRTNALASGRRPEWRLVGVEQASGDGGRPQRMDERLVRVVTAHPTPGLDRWMPRVSRAADHLAVWWVLAAGMAASGNPRMRSAAKRGLAAMLIAGPVCNAIGKQVVDRARPPRQVQERRPGRVPQSGAFPSGHSAAAAAFATAVSLAVPAAGGPVCAAAVMVAYSRVYTGAHYPGDVVAGTLAGITIALAMHRCRRHRARNEHA